MAATLPQAGPHPDPTTDAPPQPQGAALLEDRLPPWFRTSSRFPLFVAALSLLFVVLSYLQLAHTEVWGHLAYGQHLWRTGVLPLPETEPLMPMAAGARFVEPAWLAQVLAYGGYAWLGLAALRFLFAASITAGVALLCYRFYRRTGSVMVSLCGLALVLWTAATELTIPGRMLSEVDPETALPFSGLLRPELAGWLCFIAVFVLLTARRWSRANWVLVPWIFALWANLHGHVLPGLFLLAACAIGRGIDVQRRLRNWRALLVDAPLRRYVLLTEVALAATLLNPYGLGLYAKLLASEPNLQSFAAWDALTLRMPDGRALVFTVVVLAFAYRLSPRRVTATEALLLIGLGCAALWTSRGILWWAPVAAYFLVLHAHAAWNCDRRAAAPERRSLWTVAGLGIGFIALMITPAGLALRQERQADSLREMTDLTPFRAAEFLRENPPRGVVYAPPDLGDYLLWAGLPAYATSQAEHLPREVWTKAIEVARVGSGWDEVLNYDGINTVVLDKRRHARLREVLLRSNAWQVAQDDGRHVVLIRNDSI